MVKAKKNYKGGGKMYKKGGKFPDLTGDGKVTQADILKGRGVEEKKKMEKGGKVAARKAKRTERQAGKEDRFAARNRMQPDPRTKEQKAAAYRKRRNKRLTRAMMGAITGAVVGGGEYNVRQRKS